jgi:PAS domain S-box-containing protein
VYDQGVTSDLRVLQERLQETQQQLEHLYEATFEGICVHEDGLIADANETFARMLGTTVAELIGRPARELTVPEQRDELDEHISAGATEAKEGLALRRDGSTFPCLVRGRTFHIGERTLRVTTLRDLTEGRRALEALRQAEQRLRTVVGHAPIALFALDAEGRYTVCEGRGLAATGLAPEALLGRSVWDIFRDEPEVLTRIRRCLAGEEYTSVGRAFGGWWETRWVPMRDAAGTIIGLSGVAIDVAERRRAEEERARLLAQEQAARAAAEKAQQHSALLADASRLLAESLDYEGTLGAVPRAAVPALADWCVFDVREEDGSVRRVGVVHADPALADVARQLEKFVPAADATDGIGLVLRTGKPLLRSGFSPERLADDATAVPSLGLRRADHLALVGAMGMRSYLVVPVSAHGQVLGALTFVSATDPERYGLDELSLAEELAHRVALAVDNARLYRTAQEAIHARDEFLSVASHELRTPLNSLQLAVQGLLRTVRAEAIADVPLEFLSGALETLGRQGKKLVQLVESLLDVTRITNKRLVLEPTDMDLAAIVRDVAEQLAGDFARAGCALTLQAGEPVCGVWDQARLEQVVTNLLSNAMKYGAGKPVEVRVERANGLARLTVRDHGIGIPPERQERIFERFERAASASHYGGLGLGLYIVRRILAVQGGTVHVESEPGQGATFVVELP